VLSTSTRYADALAGARLATANHAPLLLTDTAGLHVDVATEVRRVLRPGGTVYLLGGDQALSSAVQASLAGLSSAYAVRRVAGSDRFRTATAIADAVGAEEDSPIYLASGTNYPDGLAVSALAARTGGVVLLTDDRVLAPATRAYLETHDPTSTRTVPVGGAAAAAVVAAGLPKAVSARAVVGTDRYDTARKVAAQFGATGVSTVGLSTGENWPDALVGSAAIGNLGGPLLLTQRATLHAQAKAAVTDLARGGTLRTGVVLGGRDTVSEATVTAFTAGIPSAGR
jgi:putative cell wall-binding protein